MISISSNLKLFLNVSVELFKAVCIHDFMSLKVSITEVSSNPQDLIK